MPSVEGFLRHSLTATQGDCLWHKQLVGRSIHPKRQREQRFHNTLNSGSVLSALAC